MEEFGKRIGIKKGSLSQLENGITKPIDQTRRSICREFGVREEWLRDGAGEMFAKEETVSLDELVKKTGLNTGEDNRSVHSGLERYSCF